MGYFLPPMGIFYHLWALFTIFSISYHLSAFSTSVAISYHLWPFPTICGHFLPFIGIFNHLSAFSTFVAISYHLLWWLICAISYYRVFGVKRRKGATWKPSKWWLFCVFGYCLSSFAWRGEKSPCENPPKSPFGFFLRGDLSRPLTWHKSATIIYWNFLPFVGFFYHLWALRVRCTWRQTLSHPHKWHFNNNKASCQQAWLL